jgi:hypothetical protein
MFFHNKKISEYSYTISLSFASFHKYFKERIAAKHREQLFSEVYGINICVTLFTV